jgi:hypothetical protein
MAMAREIPGWFMSGTKPEDYEQGIVAGEKLDGHNVAYLRSVVDPADGFGTLMQAIEATHYRGSIED